jgi:flagellar hook-basal body complex protein FliE
MSLEALRGVGSAMPRPAIGESPATEGASFADTLKRALGEVNELQSQRDDMVENMVAGEVTEVHDVMMAAEEAQLAFELMLEVRNRLLESYQELMRMQI